MTLTANSDLAEAVGTVKQEASSIQHAHGNRAVEGPSILQKGRTSMKHAYRFYKHNTTLLL